LGYLAVLHRLGAEPAGAGAVALLVRPLWPSVTGAVTPRRTSSDDVVLRKSRRSFWRRRVLRSCGFAGDSSGRRWY
jgi:hypothetical protein